MDGWVVHSLTPPSWFLFIKLVDHLSFYFNIFLFDLIDHRVGGGGLVSRIFTPSLLHHLCWDILVGWFFLLFL